jgi:hypothetical protein
LITLRTEELTTALTREAERFVRDSISVMRRRLDQSQTDLEARAKEQAALTPSRITEPPPVAPPVAPPTVAPVTLAPSASKSGILPRPPVPSMKAAQAMARGHSSRNYFVQLVRDNVNRCAIGHGLKEKTLIGHLLYFADEKREFVSKSGQLLVPDAKKYKSELVRLLNLPEWTRSDREQVLETVLRALEHNVALNVEEVLDRFYWIDRCPFDVVSENEYQAPNYSDVFPPSRQR